MSLVTQYFEGSEAPSQDYQKGIWEDEQKIREFKMLKEKEFNEYQSSLLVNPPYGIDEVSELDDRMAQCYLNRYPDLQKELGAENIVSAKEHWITIGKNERRNPFCHPIYVEELNDTDAQYYLDRYPDLQNAFGAKNITRAKYHWIEYGRSEKRNPHKFDMTAEGELDEKRKAMDKKLLDAFKTKMKKEILDFTKNIDLERLNKRNDFYITSEKEDDDKALAKLETIESNIDDSKISLSNLKGDFEKQIVESGEIKNSFEKLIEKQKKKIEDGITSFKSEKNAELDKETSLVESEIENLRSRLQNDFQLTKDELDTMNENLLATKKEVKTTIDEIKASVENQIKIENQSFQKLLQIAKEQAVADIEKAKSQNSSDISNAEQELKKARTDYEEQKLKNEADIKRATQKNSCSIM